MSRTSLKKKKLAYELFIDFRKRGEPVNIYFIAKKAKTPYSTTHKWVKEWENRYITEKNGLWKKFLNFLRKYLTR